MTAQRSEMLLTVPADWWTVSNGKLVGIKSEADGTKTWDWKQSEPLSTYLISVVAGEFVGPERFLARDAAGICGAERPGIQD